MSEQEAVLLEQQGAALWITINRPEKRNAINHEVIARIGEGYRKAESDPAIRVIVLTADGCWRQGVLRRRRPAAGPRLRLRLRETQYGLRRPAPAGGKRHHPLHRLVSPAPAPGHDGVTAHPCLPTTAETPILAARCLLR